MSKPKRVLLQTTIPKHEEDWHISRFSLLAEHLRALTDNHGQPCVRSLRGIAKLTLPVTILCCASSMKQISINFGYLL